MENSECDSLNIGDKSIDSRIEIVDKDRLCYLVKVESRGAYGIRTISKQLLSEYIEYFKTNPDSTSAAAREALCGKTKLDKFEYGYTATLSTMAQMVLSKLKDEGAMQAKNTEPVKPTCSDVDLMDEEYGYISAIKTKPFLILGGFSGTGKSVEVKLLAFATCPCDGFLNTSETSPGNYLLISVKPNWHDATDITGFRSSVQNKYFVTDFMRFLVKAKMYEDKNVPFFVCLDEMNLAPVEEYFADFLSVIESRKRKADGKIVTDPIVPASVFNERYADDFNIFMEMGLKPANEDWSADDINALGQKKEGRSFCAPGHR